MNLLLTLPVLLCLPQSDHPKQIEIEVLMIGLTDDAENPKTMEDPRSFLKSATADGHVRWSRTFRLTTLDQLPAKIQHGEQQPVVVGYSVRGFTSGRNTSSQQRATGGSPSRIPSMQMQSTGAVVSVTPRITEDGAILVNLDLEDSRLAKNEAADEESFAGTSTVQVQISTTVSIRDGKPVVLKLAQSGQTSEILNGQVLAIISADVVE